MTIKFYGAVGVSLGQNINFSLLVTQDIVMFSKKLAKFMAHLMSLQYQLVPMSQDGL